MAHTPIKQTMDFSIRTPAVWMFCRQNMILDGLFFFNFFIVTDLWGMHAATMAIDNMSFFCFLAPNQKQIKANVHKHIASHDGKWQFDWAWVRRSISQSQATGISQATRNTYCIHCCCSQRCCYTLFASLYLVSAVCFDFLNYISSCLRFR